MASGSRSTSLLKSFRAGTAFLAGGPFFLYGQDAPNPNFTGGTPHGHGAAPDKGGVQFNINRGGITWLARKGRGGALISAKQHAAALRFAGCYWLGEVSDAEFKVKPKR